MSDQITQQALPTGTWSADKVHSTVGFAVAYLAGSFQGTFSEFEARLSDGALSGSAGVSSVEVKDPNLATHLQSPDFFDAERFPRLSFEADDISRSGDELTIGGELTRPPQRPPVHVLHEDVGELAVAADAHQPVDAAVRHPSRRRCPDSSARGSVSSTMRLTWTRS